MISLLPNNEERKLLSAMYTESFQGYGVKCSLWLVVNESHPDHGTTSNVELSDTPITVDISLDPHPQIKLLKLLGWYNEDTSTVPLIAYIPRYMNDELRTEILISEHAKISMISDPTYLSKEFDVSAVSGNSFNPILWICKLTPHRGNFIDDTPVINPDTNFNYLRIEKE